MPTRPRSYPARPAPDAPDDLSTTSSMMAAGVTPRLWRSRSNRVVAGVIGGLAEKFGMEPVPMRLLYGLLTVFSGGLLAIPYVGIWAITRAHGPARSSPRLWRSGSNRVIAGVIGGLAEKFGFNATFARVMFAMVSVFTGGVPGLITYLLLWAITRPMDASETEYLD